MYEWHNKKYYGAAHGITGILFVLLQAGEKYITEDIMKNYIKASIDYLKSKMYTSGNVPSSHGSENDKLIHWCHGAPGAIHLFLLSSQSVKLGSIFNSIFMFCNSISKMINV
jgi:lantibiotic modifying enzyme